LISKNPDPHDAYVLRKAESTASKAKTRARLIEEIAASFVESEMLLIIYFTLAVSGSCRSSQQKTGNDGANNNSGDESELRSVHSDHRQRSLPHSSFSRVTAGAAVSFALAQDPQPSGLERIEILARPLFGHRPIEHGDVTTAVAVAPFHLPKVAALAIGMDADFALPLVVAVCGGIVESVPHLEGSVNASRMIRIGEIGGRDFFQRPRPGGGLRATRAGFFSASGLRFSCLPARLHWLAALLHRFVTSALRRASVMAISIVIGLPPATRHPQLDGYDHWPLR
jgi:hypothetical protein